MKHALAKLQRMQKREAAQCSVTCIIPAFNEGPRIASILTVVVGHPLVQEIIVIDDGSRDDTVKQIQAFPTVRLVIHDQNKGKTEALYSGLSIASSDIVMLLDADLIGLSEKNITELIIPVTSGAANISISMRKNSPWIDRCLGIDYISGERVFDKSILLNNVDELLAIQPWGFEVFFNRLLIKEAWRIKVVFWKNVISPSKSVKYSFFRGIGANIGMLRDMFHTVSVFEIVRQFIYMRRLAQIRISRKLFFKSLVNSSSSK